MPLVRITLKKGMQAEFKQHISKSIHTALVSVFGIPDDDLFQIIEELELENIVYPSSYMGIAHTSDIIYITIIAKLGRNMELKKQLYKGIAKNITESTDHNISDVFITIIENTAENWSFGNGDAQLV